MRVDAGYDYPARMSMLHIGLRRLLSYSLHWILTTVDTSSICFRIKLFYT